MGKLKVGNALFFFFFAMGFNIVRPSDNVVNFATSGIIASLATVSTALIATVPLPAVCNMAPFTFSEMRNVFIFNVVTTFSMSVLLHKTSEDPELILAGIGLTAAVPFAYTLYHRCKHIDKN